VRRPLVVKLGTGLVVGEDGAVRKDLLHARAREIGELVAGKEPVCIVSSGAIALGLPRLGLKRRPRSVPRLQAASALGQTKLQAAWEEALGAHRVPAAQILLAAGDVADRLAYVNARRAFEELFRLGAVPVVNENDATATDEITFGDNDALAAQVAVLVNARLLVLLTEVEGLYSRAPGTPGAELITEGELAGGAELGAGTELGRGGMASKVIAAQMASGAGIPTVIAGGAGEEVLGPILAGEGRGTRFKPEEQGATAFRMWLLFAKPATGRLHVDAGARRALIREGASLLGVGVVDCEGRFEPGAAVEVVGPDGVAFAKGIAAADSERLTKRPRGVLAVHRDRMVLYS
jgi:glutamate 5-kinase